MRTEEEIRKRINFLKEGIKQSKEDKDFPELSRFIEFDNLEKIDVLNWVLAEDEE